MPNYCNIFAFALVLKLVASSAIAEPTLHDSTVTRFVTQLSSQDAAVRTSAAENLGFLRAYAAAEALTALLSDDSADSRRAAATSLAWCGGRSEIDDLLDALDDSDWSVRQAVWVALTNLTGQELPFDSHESPAVRKAQVSNWRQWWQRASKQSVPASLSLKGLSTQSDLAVNCPVSASSTYKGPASILTDAGESRFWQTKNVPFPQHCTVDLGSVRKVGAISVVQYGKGYCMTDYAVAVSSDGTDFRQVLRKKELSSPDLLITLPDLKTRYVRIISYDNEFTRYPTTFYSISVFEEVPSSDDGALMQLECERKMRALGALGCRESTSSVLKILQPFVKKRPANDDEKLMVQSGIRALSRLPSPEGRKLLIRFLGSPYWARYAADALGEIGGRDAALALLNVYPDYAIVKQKKPPKLLPKDDVPKLDPTDRMYETPHAIAQALTRFTFEDTELQEKLRSIIPLLVMNMANDFDGAMLYEEQAWHQVNRYLLQQAGVCDDLCELCFELLGEPSAKDYKYLLPKNDRQRLIEFSKTAPGGSSFPATWLTALCRDKKYSPRLINLLKHKNGWVSINATKMLMFMNESSALNPIYTLLKKSKTEAEHGFFTGFLFNKKGVHGQDEYNAPSPCRREAFTRALSVLGSAEHVPLLIKLLNDDRNVLEVQYSALISLDMIGTQSAIAAVKTAAENHPFHSIKLKAREALWKESSIGRNRFTL